VTALLAFCAAAEIRAAGVAGMKTVNGLPAEVPPPGEGLDTVTWSVPTETISAEEIDALTPFVPTKVVVRALPFH
jgi:hypothetical protein